MEKEKKWMKAPYPKNLLYAVRGSQEIEMPTELTQDVLSGVQYALSTLSEREQLVIKCRFVDRMYLHTIGEALGIRAERTRQIENEAIRKLRHRRNLMFMTKGIEGYIRELNKSEYERGYQVGFDAGYEQGIMDAPQGVTKTGKSITIMSLPIEALGVSTRSRNALDCAGYKTIGDILELQRRQIIHIKNLGPKQRQEIAAGLHRYGVTETDWDFFRPRDEHKNNLEVKYNEYECDDNTGR